MIRAAVSLSTFTLNTEQIRQFATESQENFEAAIHNHTHGREYIVTASDTQMLANISSHTQTSEEELVRDALECFRTVTVQFILRKEAGETFSKEDEFVIPFDNATHLLAERHCTSQAEASRYVQKALLQKRSG